MKTQKKIEAVEAWAVVGVAGQDTLISLIGNQHGANTGQLAIYEKGTYFSKQVMEAYKLKIVPVLITPLRRAK